MLLLLCLWLAVGPLTLLGIALALWLPELIRGERGAVLPPWARRPRGRHRQGLSAP